MKKNATVAIVLLILGIPVLVGSALRTAQFDAVIERTGTGGDVATLNVILTFASLIAIAVGICFGLTAIVQRLDRHGSAR